jgi:hypothetical protein
MANNGLQPAAADTARLKLRVVSQGVMHIRAAERCAVCASGCLLNIKRIP